jgi:putative transposase
MPIDRRLRSRRCPPGHGGPGFVAMLEYKAQLYGREFHRIGRFEPTSRNMLGVRREGWP